MHIVIFFLLQKQRRCFYVVVALVMFVYVFEFEFSVMRSPETSYQVLIYYMFFLGVIFTAIYNKVKNTYLIIWVDN